MDFVPTVVGEKELNSRSVNVRNRNDVGSQGKTDTIALDVAVQKLVALNASRSLTNQLP